MSDFDPATETANRPFVGWTFFFTWILLNTIGQIVLKFAFLEWGLGNSLLVFDIYVELWSVQWFMAWIGNGLISGIVIGLVIGGLQWFLLQKYFEWADRWLIFSVIGWILVDLWSSFIGYFMSGTLAIYLFFISSMIAGAILGTMQWLVLRQHVYQAGWWIAANSLAWFVSSLLFFIGVQVGVVNTSTPYELVNRIDTVVRGIIRETIPGICLWWLLRNKLKEEFEG
jgi:hypothetical protein